MNTKSTVKMIEKDIKKLNKDYSKGKIYIAGIIKEQESIISLAIKTLEKNKGK